MKKSKKIKKNQKKIFSTLLLLYGGWGDVYPSLRPFGAGGQFFRTLALDLWLFE